MKGLPLWLVFRPLHEIICLLSEGEGSGHPGLCAENDYSSFPGHWCIESALFTGRACSLSQSSVKRVSSDQSPEPPLLFQQMAGNPDQQEDNVDEQYQEEGEEEVGTLSDLLVIALTLNKPQQHQLWQALCRNVQKDLGRIRKTVSRGNGPWQWRHLDRR